MKKLIIIILFFLLSISSATAIGETDPQIDLNLQENEYGLSFLPLEKGEIAILHLPEGINYLINTGPSENKKDLYSILKQFGANNIQGIIVTEKREYFPEFITEIIKDFKVSKVYMGKSFLETQGQNNINAIPLSEQDKVKLSNQLQLEVIYDGGNTGEGLDFKISFNKHLFLWLTSYTKPVQSHLLNQKLSDVNIVKVPIYNKSNFISEELLKHIDPQTAILYRSKQRMLNSEFLELLQETWIDVYLTGQHGLITIKFNPLNYEVITFPNDDAIEEEPNQYKEAYLLLQPNLLKNK
ncbi:hypothetical protein [Rossellomorea sp. BNER]|uniref:hypothetical protein n=1 Tax=Rossellomorea sp. BNER TaxID=2962031 RepID=UPI003AF24298|nr:hypothetical protein [Rossellomorea sp. BNER]